MKILVFSDSHLCLENLIKMVDLENPQVVICGGDHSRDALELSYIEDKLDYFIVRGNCDMFDHSFKDILQFKLEDKKIYLTHGHLHGVKMTLEKLKKATKESNEDIVIFGHTHIPYHEIYEGIHYFNPGAAKDGNYGILEIKGNNISFIHKKLVTGKTVKTFEI